jgi:hypothetical protein
VRFTNLTLLDAKKKLPDDVKRREVDELLDECETDKQLRKVLSRSIEKIMIAHRNTKLFLFMMSGPFLAIMLLIKYIFKVLILYYLYK